MERKEKENKRKQRLTKRQRDADTDKILFTYLLYIYFTSLQTAQLIV